MVNSRIDKYRDLRSGLKEEVGINRDNMSDVIDAVVDTDDEDDFLMSVNRFYYLFFILFYKITFRKL